MTKARTTGPDETRSLAAREPPAAPPTARALPLVDGEHFAVHHEHARGGLGRILAAEDRVLERPVAIKELLAPGPEAAARFVREAMLTARLQHPAIVPVYEAGRWPNGEPFYAMKMVAGRSLKEAIAAAAGLDARLALLPHVITVADAVAYAHSHRIVHRDLKPANVVLGEFGETVVIDWGLAKRLDEVEERRAESAAPTPDGTATGSVLGTARYMPPEQALGLATDERADVYALGAMLYHLLAGAPPYGGSWPEALAAVLAGPPRPLREVEPATPSDLADIVARAMAREPAARYASAREVAEDLRRFQTGQLVSSHHYTAWTLARRWLQRHRVPVALTAGFAAVLAVVAVVAFARVSRAREAAEERRNHVVLLQARGALANDPATALAWLKSYPIATGDLEAVRAVFEDARGHGAVAVVPDVLLGTVAPLAGHRFRFVLTDGRVVDLDPESGARSAQRIGPLPDPAVCADLSKSGNLVVVGERRALVLFDLAGRTRRVFPLPDGHAISHDWCAFTDDEQWLTFGVTGGLGRVALATGAIELFAGEDAAGASALAPDGATLVWNAWPAHTVHTLELASGRTATWSSGSATPGYILGFTADGRHVFAGTDEGHVVAWSRAGALERDLPVCQSPLGRVIAAGGARVAIRCSDGPVTLLDLDDGKTRALGAVGNTLGWVDDVVNADHGDEIIGMGRGTAEVWNVASGETARFAFDEDVFYGRASSDGAYYAAMTPISHKALILRLPVLGDHVLAGGSARFSPDGRALVATRADGVAVCDPAGASCRLLAVDAPTWAAASFDARRVGFASATVSGWFDLDSGARHDVGTGLRAAAWSPVDGRLALGENGRRLLIVDTDHPAAAPRVLEDGAYAYAVTWSRDGRQLAWADDIGTVEVAEGEARRSVKADTAINALVFSADGRQLFGGGFRKLWIWDTAAGTTEVVTPWHDLRITDVALSPDGRLLATAGEDRAVRLLELASRDGRLLAGHTGAVAVLGFSPDGRRLASAGTDGAVRLWDVASGDVHVFVGHEQPIHSLSYASDGRLVTASDDRVILWDLVRVPPPLVNADAVRAAIDAETTAILGADDRPITPIR